MSLKSDYRTCFIVIIFILLTIPVLTQAQGNEKTATVDDKNKLSVLPFTNGIVSVNDGFLEGGLELNYDLSPEKLNKIVIKPFFRIPFQGNIQNAQVDKSSDKWKAALSLTMLYDSTGGNGPIHRFGFGLQGEYGRFEYKYTDIKEVKKKNDIKDSFAGEIEGYYFFSKGEPYATQNSLQFRFRYERQVKLEQQENVLPKEPVTIPKFSPAIAFHFYPGITKISLAPVLYYNFFGNSDTWNPFLNGRMHIEFWFYYHPLITNTPNIRIGIAPFINFKTHGNDDKKKFDYGGELQLTYQANFNKVL